MGAVNESRHTPGPLTEPELHDWYEGELHDMAREGGTDAYCRNWNSNSGLQIVRGTFTLKEAQAYAEKHADKRGDVLAFRIGDFSKAWPVTKAQKDIQEKLVKLEAESNEFDYRILERAQQQKSKTKKCLHCESSINVHKIPKPTVKELTKSSAGRYDVGLSYQFGRYLLSSFYGFCDCPVCSKNLLKTETDKKNQASLETRLKEARKKEQDSRQAYAKEQLGKPQAYWYVEGCCGS